MIFREVATVFHLIAAKIPNCDRLVFVVKQTQNPEIKKCFRKFPEKHHGIRNPIRKIRKNPHPSSGVFSASIKKVLRTPIKNPMEADWGSHPQKNLRCLGAGRGFGWFGCSWGNPDMEAIWCTVPFSSKNSKPSWCLI